MRGGILGVGFAGGRHLQAFRCVPGVPVVAADPAHDRREHARAAGVPVVPTLDDLLACAPMPDPRSAGPPSQETARRSP